jgi:hypothetical protein
MRWRLDAPRYSLGDSFGSWALERITQSIKSLAYYRVHRVKTVTAHKLFRIERDSAACDGYTAPKR